MQVFSIIFICGCIEPGRDGVGDYTRRLAGELMRLGHSVGMLALKDSFVNEFDFTDQLDGEVKITSLRLPAHFAEATRLQKAYIWIDEQNPQWVSLQYVPYSYQSKGIPLRLAKNLQFLGKGRKWHFMFHELCIGMETDASTKDRLIGMLQRYILKSLCAKLQPEAIHTQTQVYLTKLKIMGIRAKYLPLFSNIPISFNASGNDYKRGFLANNNLNFVLFGSIQPGAPIEAFVDELAEYLQHKNASASLVTIGKCGQELKRWTRLWQSHGFAINNMGEQSAQIISKVLSQASIGITTTPFAVVEKSGSVAAMRAHHLPVLCVARDWQPKDILDWPKSREVVLYRTGTLTTGLAELEESNYTHNSLTKVTGMFLDSLKNVLANNQHNLKCT